MKTLLVAIPLVFFGLTASAGNLTVTCGEGAYDALDQKDLSLAEFALVLKTKGPNNPPELVTLNDNYEDISGSLARLDYQFPNITLNMKNYDKYEITSLKGCEDLETATADIAYSRYVGGFAGYAAPIKAKCSCQR